MHRTVKALRVIILLALAGFLFFIYKQYTGNQRQGREQKNIDAARRGSDEPNLVADTFEDVQTINGKVVSRIRARRTTGLTSGWFVLEDAHLTLYRPDNTTIDLSCPRAEFHMQTKEALLQKGVKIASSDGMEIATEEMRFDGRRVINDIPLTFKIAKWEGRAGGADIDVTHDSVRLVNGVEARLAANPPQNLATVVTADEARFFRKVNEFIFSQKASIKRGTDTIAASSITARTDASRQRLVSLAGNGQVEIDVVNSGAAAGGASVNSARVTSDSFFASFGGEGEITSLLAVSAGQSHAILRGATERLLDAQQFRLLFTGGKPGELHAEQNVRMEEKLQPPRIVTAQNAAFYFDPETGRVATAQISGGMEYREGTTMARSERASLDNTQDRLTLVAQPNAQPVITRDGQMLRANRIEYAPSQRTLRGTGAVLVHLVPKSTGAAASGTTMFPSGSQPVYVNADSVVMRQDDRTALFSGNVKAWQETNTLFAKELRVVGEGDEVTASGGVRAVLYNARDSARRSPVLARSNQLVARKKENRINLEGAVRIDDETRSLSSDDAVLFFGADRKLDRLEAKENVVIADNATGRRGTGTSATYQMRQQMVFLNGAPAVMTDARGAIRGEQIVFDLGRNKVEVTRGASPTQTTYVPEKDGQ